MDENKKISTSDALSDVDALMSTGAAPSDLEFTLDDILREFGLMDTPKKETKPKPEPESVVKVEPVVETKVEPVEAEPEPAAETKPEPVKAEVESEPESVAEVREEVEEEESDPFVEDIRPLFRQRQEAANTQTAATEDSAAAEEAASVREVPPAPVEAPMDSVATANFIMEQVNSAMGEAEAPEEREDTNPLKTFFNDARRRMGLRKHAERDDSAVDAFTAAMEEQAADRVVDMPVSPFQPIRERVGRLQDKANDFADNMWAESAPLTEDEKITEANVPGTDEEELPRKPKKQYRVKLPLKSFPDTPAEELGTRYRMGLGFMRQRMMYLLVLTLVMLYFNLAPGCGLPLPFHLGEQLRVLGGILTWCLGLGCAIGLDVLWLGLTAPARGRTGMHTLTAMAVLATLVDGLCFTLLGRPGPVPFAAMASFSLLCAMWGAYSRKSALAISCRAVCSANEPYRVTLDEDKWDGDAAFNKETGSREGFGKQIQSLDGAERIYRVCVPVLALVAAVFALLASVGQGKPGLFLWSLSAILVAGAPAGGLLAYGLPYLRLTHRLDHFGAVLAGWDGVEAMSGPANILIKDEDLFPVGSVSLNASNSLHGMSIEKLAGCSASMLRSAGSGLYHLFDEEIRRQGGFYRRVEDLQCYESGGLTANIRGESVMIGNGSFMAVMRIPISAGMNVKRAVFCVFNKSLEGIFSLHYELSSHAQTSIEALIKAGVQPVLATRDFNINPEMLRTECKLPADLMEFPPIERRRELSAPNQPHNSVVGAFLTREGMGPYSDAIIGGRRLKRVVQLNALLCLLSSVMGMLLTLFLTSMMAFTSLSPLNLMLFLVIWLVPVLAISGAVDRY